MRRDGKVNARTASAPTKAKSSTAKPPAAPLSPAPAGASPPAVGLIRPRTGPILAKLDAAAPSKRHARVSATSESKQIGKDGQPDGPVQPAATHTKERKPTGHRAATRYWDNGRYNDKLANSLLGEQTTAKSKLVSAMDNPFLLSLAWPTVSTMLKQLHKYNPAAGLAEVHTPHGDGTAAWPKPPTTLSKAYDSYKNSFAYDALSAQARFAMIPKTGLFIAFYHGLAGPWSMLSNWYVQPAWPFYPPKYCPDTRSWDFVPDKKSQRPILVTSAEQAIMICKATLMRDSANLALLSALPAREPAEAKRLGKSVAKFDEVLWLRHREDIASYVISEKFCSDPLLAACLDATGDATLCEFSQNDKDWGIGVANMSPDKTSILPVKDWVNPFDQCNLLGRTLMSVRGKLRGLQLPQRETTFPTAEPPGPGKDPGDDSESDQEDSGDSDDAAAETLRQNTAANRAYPPRPGADAQGGSAPATAPKSKQNSGGISAMGIPVDSDGKVCLDFESPSTWTLPSGLSALLSASPEEAMLISQAMRDAPLPQAVGVPPAPFATLSYHAKHDQPTNDATKMRFLEEVSRCLPMSGPVAAFLRSFSGYAHHSRSSRNGSGSDSDEFLHTIRASGVLLLQDHYDLLRAFYSWLPLDPADELPGRFSSQPSAFDEELLRASSVSNVMKIPPAGSLASELYDTQNVCLPRPVQAARVFPAPVFLPQDPASGAWLPHLLYRPDGFTFSAKHGDFVTRYIIPAEPGSRDGAVLLSPERIYHWECKWCEIHAGKLAAATSVELGGTRPASHVLPTRARPREPNIFVIPPEARDPRTEGAVYDLRSWNDDHTQPIRPIALGDERRTSGLGSAAFAPGIRQLQREFNPPDQDTAEQMASAVYTGAMDGAFRGSVYSSNYNGYLEHADYAVANTAAEVESGVIQGSRENLGTLRPHFNPQHSFACSVATRPGSDKLRITGDGGDPRDWLFDGQPVSNNDSQDTSDPVAFPPLNLPSVLTFARNFAIGQTCSESCPECSERLDLQVLLTDWVAYYRSFVVSIFYLWTQGNIRLPSGLTTDTGMYFGDRHAPFPSCLCMTWLLFVLCSLFRLRLDKVTSWCVFARQPRDPTYAGVSSSAAHPHMDDPPEVSGSSSHAALSAALRWDEHPKVRDWRQKRFDTAIASGMAPDEAYWHSIPFARQGFYDDGSFSVAACLMMLLIEALLELVTRVGVGLAYTKMVIAYQDDTLAACSVHKRCADANMLPRIFSDLSLTTSKGSPVILGKQCVLSTQLIQDTAVRIRTLSDTMGSVILSAGNRRLAALKVIRSIIGVLIFVTLSQPPLRALMNAPIRCLCSQKSNSLTLRKSGQVPFSYQAEDAFRTIIYAIQHEIGRPFASDLALPAYKDCIFLMHDAAGLAEDDLESYRGGGSWIWIPASQQIFMSTSVFPMSLLRSEHSTSLELMNGNLTLEYALRRWPGVAIVEIYDNQAATASARRLACHSDSLNKHMAYRRDVLLPYLRTTSVHTIWAQRELGTLADMLSKNELAQFLAALSVRGYPPPLEDMFVRRPWYI